MVRLERAVRFRCWRRARGDGGPLRRPSLAGRSARCRLVCGGSLAGCRKVARPQGHRQGLCGLQDSCRAMKSLPQAEVRLTVPFHDVDVMEIVWHGHYAKYFEIARCALLDKIDYNYLQMKQSGYSWPIIELKTRYIRPASFGQDILVRARIVEYELRLKIDYLISDAASGARLTKGHTVQVAVDPERRELLLASPTILLKKLGVQS
jgi:acyl-CoA thioester hydrolase